MTNYISRREEERTVHICIYRESSLQAATASQTRFLGYAKTAHGPAVPCHTMGRPITPAAAADTGKDDILLESAFAMEGTSCHNISNYFAFRRGRNKLRGNTDLLSLKNRYMISVSFYICT